jgi:hypothetical protein
MKLQTILVDGGQFEAKLAESLGARRVYSPGEIQEALRLDTNTLWLADTLPPLHEFDDVGRGRYQRRLLALEPIDRTRLPFLRTMFDTVVAPDDSLQVLPQDQVVAVLGTEHPEDYLIGGVYNAEDDFLILYRGNLDTLTVPLAWMKANPVTEPDPTDFEIIDYGQTIRLGDYEAGVDAILYKFDAEYRRRKKEKRRNLDDSFGASLRRARVAKGLNQDDFSNVTARTIRRIESGEVASPRAKTIRAIAADLGVEADEIETY